MDFDIVLLFVMIGILIALQIVSHYLCMEQIKELGNLQYQSLDDIADGIHNMAAGLNAIYTILETLYGWIEQDRKETEHASEEIK